MATFFELLDLNPERREKVDEDAFLSIISKDPDVVKKKYRFDSFEDDALHPLHMICALGASVDCVKACYKAYPDALDNDYTQLGAPLHYACFYGASVEVVHYLAKKDSDALEQANKEGKTPLHLACASSSDTDVVVFLTERGPKAAEKKDKEGNTPLNLACTADEPPILAVVEDLTEVCPDAGVIVADDGTWPLLNAINQNADISVLKDLIVSKPACAELKTPVDGWTALHCAIKAEIISSVLKDLIKAYPDALQVKDSAGRIPLHLAIECQSSITIIKLLVKKCPASVDTENTEGEIPHKMADRLGLDEDIVQFLNPFEEESD